MAQLVPSPVPPFPQGGTGVLPPPTEPFSVLRWMRKNLFGSWRDALLTVVMLVLIVLMARSVLNWVFTEANWSVIAANFKLILTGQYPFDQLWRLWLLLCLLAVLIGLSWGTWAPKQHAVGIVLAVLPLLLMVLPFGDAARPFLIAVSALGVLGYFVARRTSHRLRRFVGVMWVIYLPLAILVVRGFGEDHLFSFVPSNLWGGLLLTLMLTAVGILLSFPLGIALALGRRSDLPAIKWFCIGYIEVVRGVPLITVLFMAQLMLPLFLPANLTIDRVIRAIAGLTLFTAAYLAENVRGGLQAIPRGQYEAAHALGLNSFHTMRLIVLPQALRLVIPIIVGQFIALFKDTSLVAVVGLLDLLGIANAILAQPAYLGTQKEVYVFIGLIYWVLSYVMGAISRRLEATAAGQR